MDHDSSWYRDRINQEIGRVKALRDTITKKKAELQLLKKRAGYVERAQVFLQQVAKETQEQLSFRISDIVQSAIDSCSDGGYNFSVRFEIKRGKTEARLVIEKDGAEMDPMESLGGGIVDIESFALRIAAWSISKRANVMILDEPFKFMSRELQPKAGKILSSLSHRLGLQIIMVTHNRNMVDIADRVFEVSMKDGVSIVKQKEALGGRGEK
jgi:DNA repair exonuclease SbcCD ATPase subunit